MFKHLKPKFSKTENSSALFQVNKEAVSIVSLKNDALNIQYLVPQ